MKKLLICFVLLLLSSTNIYANHRKIIVIDAGHQYKGNNALEPIGPGSKIKKAKVTSGTRGVVTKRKESTVNLEVAKKLQKALVKEGYIVYMVRTKQKVNISNIQRAKYANSKKADAYIRLHCDGGSSSMTGAHTLAPSKKNKFMNKSIISKSRTLSKLVLKYYCKETGCKNRGVDSRNDLTGTNWSKVPVTLLEMGFMTNPKEDRLLSNKTYQAKMVKGMVKGINAYLK